MLTAFQISGTGGNAYLVGDVLSLPASVGACTNPATWTVTAITAPTGSFTDTAGTHWQIVLDQGNYINIRQFGAKQDFTLATGDAGATNDQASIQNALNFASAGLGPIDGKGYAGHTVMVPRGGSLVCGGLMVPQAVSLRGVHQGASLLKECDAELTTQQFITLGDPLWHLSTFFESVEDLTLYGAASTISGNIAMVYSNSQQQGTAIKNVSIYSRVRGCVYTEIGYGGKAFFHISSMYCIPDWNAAPYGVSLNYPAAQQLIDGQTQFTAGGIMAQPYIQLNTGAINIVRDVYCESGVTCVQINVAAGHGTQALIGPLSGSGLTNLLLRISGSATGQIKAGSLSPSGGANTINNGGTITTGNVIADTAF